MTADIVAAATRRGCDGKRIRRGGGSRLLALTLVALIALGGLAGPAAARGVDGSHVAEVASARSLAVYDLTGRTAIVTGSVSGVLLRAKASFGSEVVTTLAEGTAVELRIDVLDTVLDADGQTRWWPVQIGDQTGWITGYYLIDPPNEPGVGLGRGTQEGESAPSFDAGANPSAVTAVVVDPEGVNFRAEPEVTAPIFRQLARGAVVTLRTNEIAIVYDINDLAWWPIEVDGQFGWVVGAYLASGVDETAGQPTVSESVAAVSFAAGQYAAANTGPGGLNIRAEAAASADRVGFIPDGVVVQVMDGPVNFADSVNGWYLVTDGSVTGYVDADFLRLADQIAAPEGAPTEPQPVLDPVRFVIGEIAAVSTGGDSGLNLRSEASTSAGIVKALANTAAVRVLDGPFYDADGAGWYQVSDGSVEAFASGRYLVATDLTSLPEPAPVAVEPEPEPQPPPPPPAPVAGVGSGTFVWPTQGTISQYYGCSPFPFYPYDANLGCPFHNGLDIAATSYTPIVASDGGVVSYAGWCDCGLGYYVEIDHGNGYRTVYGHMAEMPYVATGQAVSQGQLIGPIGSTGFSTGPHIHFMVKVNGVTIDPLSVLG